MNSAIELLSLQMQSNMLSKLLASESTGNSALSSLTGATQSNGFSFEELLQNCIEEMTGESTGLSGITDSSVFQNMGIYQYPSINITQPVAVGNMTASNSLIDFIKVHEGYSSTAYTGADVQNRTIGYGHVIQQGENYTNLTQMQATSLLKNDLSSSVASVNKEFAGTSLTQNQFDSLVSFAYNLGDNIWSSAPTLVSDIKSGASAEKLKSDFTAYDHCNGQELTGLYNRRVDEWKMFTSGSYNLHI